MNDVDVQETCRLSDSSSHCNMVQVEKILPVLPHLVPGVHWEFRPWLCKNLKSPSAGLESEILDGSLFQVSRPGDWFHFTLPRFKRMCFAFWARPWTKMWYQDCKKSQGTEALRHLCSTMRLEPAIPRISWLLKGRDEISRTRADFLVIYWGAWNFSKGPEWLM